VRLRHKGGAAVKVKLVEIKREDLLWDRGEDGTKAFFKHDFTSRSSRRANVDPTFAYPHDTSLLLSRVQQAAEVFPIDFETTVIVLPVEKMNRMNACAGFESDWDSYDDEKKCYTNFFPFIEVQGKSIPPHPAMTRYLAAHEYGHLVESHMENRLEPGKIAYGQFEDEYITMREIPFIKRGYNQGWHQAISEIIACDFRIAMCRAEVEFWPHPGITHPDLVPQVRKWWEEKKEKYAHR
jgi:hypothetical protein